jgi:hypothetical protein
MKNFEFFHGFAMSEKDDRRKDQLIVDWLAPMIAWLAVLAISASVLAAMLGER